MNNKNLFLTVQEAGKSKIMAPEDSLFGEDCFLFTEGCLFLSPHTAEEARKFSGVSILRALTPITRALFS